MHGELLVRFTDGREVVYTRRVLSLLITDKDVTDIVDMETGEILKERGIVLC